MLKKLPPHSFRLVNTEGTSGMKKPLEQPRRSSLSDWADGWLPPEGKVP
jgi:hypothetical protein